MGEGIIWEKRYEQLRNDKWYEQLRNDIRIRATEKMKRATEIWYQQLRKDMSNREILWATENWYGMSN